ncbi:3-oxoacyl-[acyl-carrier-protein] reductase FabG [Roseovarius albus]|uniref:3-oxoacyl-[acyl-carrier-protein] reductase FabG n=1 Tax=Roseovarius albus TaxID=1247867 RepID=A0A1X7A760_9RHOB|nr:SDR family oxidoreductase [Roseovarius albus]SLN72329.1 3-oxoacyl-[acyl-carrier-protein] reductase FabG [Roseovarius albus]
MASLAGKVALVTGASAPLGIGRAIARRLAGDGAVVVVTDISGSVELGNEVLDRSDLLQDLVADVHDAGGTGIALTLDVTDAGSIQACIAEVKRQLSRIDILVNNAGSLAGSDVFLSTTPAQWEASFRVNLLGPMVLAQAVIPDMQANGGGRIINIGSTGSLGAEAGFGAYTAMKHGLVGLSKTIAAEFGKDGILCNTVCPGYISTDMHLAANERLAQESGLSVDEIKTRRYADVALRQAGSPEDVAAAVAYLAGPDASYVTGINFPVSGGIPFGI